MNRPRPVLDNWNRPFWAAAAEHRLIVQRCTDCGTLRHPPGPSCGSCLSPEFAWDEVSGRGTVASWVVFHQRYFAEFADALPYTVALVHLAEGVPFIADLDTATAAEVAVGSPVTVAYDDVDGDLSVPYFVTASAARSAEPAEKGAAR